MLQLRPSCECCDIALPPDSTDARICSFECTFCASCADLRLEGNCPNCGGELVTRPRRPAEKLAKNPASTERVYNPEGCQAMKLKALSSEIQQGAGSGKSIPVRKVFSEVRGRVTQAGAGSSDQR